MRTFYYVDGLNLYKRCLEGSPYKWLDLAALFRLELPDNDPARIRYFTAKLKPGIGTVGSDRRQQTYLKALASIPGLSRHYGDMRSDPDWMRAMWPAVAGERVEVWHTREKGSDVNLAAHLFHDLAKRSEEYDAVVVVTHDSDQVATIRLARDVTDKPVGVLDPWPARSKHLHRAASFYRNIHRSNLAKAQLPDPVPIGRAFVSKPTTW
jgi:hypothetical protein